MKKPLLVGINNPLSDDPEHALYPYPPNCTGARVHRLLMPMTRSEYLNTFDRTNMVEGALWTAKRARDNVARIRALMSGRRSVLLGAEVHRALGFAKLARLRWHKLDDARFILLPHPSGRNHWYNDRYNAAAARRALTSAMVYPA